LLSLLETAEIEMAESLMPQEAHLSTGQVRDDKLVRLGTDIVPRYGGFSRQFVISRIYVWLNIFSS
jgi:hypothetical protein